MWVTVWDLVSGLANHLARVDAKLDKILGIVQDIQKGETKMAANLNDLKSAVANERTVVDSTVTLLNNLTALIAANKTDPVAIQAILDDVTGQSANLGAAVAANTPAA